MWPKNYRDYKVDKPLIQQPIEPGQLIGCEMHDINGWGNTLQQPKPKKRGFLATMLIHIFGKRED